ncbi:BnaC02g45830D [Brassica napus]|uniref:BnaC02g45830D protein n=1 Tax=Brassica napus TaxID=3708 RepID=A0A078IQF1_BRANA|nr:BnaC02g45830D [Brassica napus]
MIDFLSYPYFIFPLILFFKYLHIKKKFYWLKTERDERLQGKKTKTGLSSSPLSPSEFVAPNPKPTLVSLSISSHVCYLGLVLPLPRTDEIHIPNPSWMQSPSYEEAWNEPHIWFRPNKVLIFFRTLIQSLVIYNPTDL